MSARSPHKLPPRRLCLGDLNDDGRVFLCGYVEAAVFTRPSITVEQIAQDVLDVARQRHEYLKPEAIARFTPQLREVATS